MAIPGPYYRIDLPIGISDLHEAVSFSVAFRDQVERVGGTCRAFRGKEAVHIFCTVIENDLIDDLTKSWGKKHVEEGTSFAACVVSLPDWPLEPGFAVGEIFHGSITKKFLMTLPAGAWLCIPGGSDHTVDHIQPGTDRQRLWENMTESGIASRRRYIMWSLPDIRAVQQSWAVV
jgi:hypothetical protein